MRDLMLPLVLKAIADGKQQQRVYGYHIDWGGKE